jgi:hypothetical protein
MATDGITGAGMAGVGGALGSALAMLRIIITTMSIITTATTRSHIAGTGSARTTPRVERIVAGTADGTAARNFSFFAKNASSARKTRGLLPASDLISEGIPH